MNQSPLVVTLKNSPKEGKWEVLREFGNHYVIKSLENGAEMQIYKALCMYDAQGTRAAKEAKIAKAQSIGIPKPKPGKK